MNYRITPETKGMLDFAGSFTSEFDTCIKSLDKVLGEDHKLTGRLMDAFNKFNDEYFAILGDLMKERMEQRELTGESVDL